MNNEKLKLMSDAIRVLSIDAIEKIFLPTPAKLRCEFSNFCKGLSVTQ